jgi:hypothetical protein
MSRGQGLGLHILHAPEACGLTKRPIGLWTQWSINRGLHNGHAAKTFVEHAAEWDEDVVVQARPSSRRASSLVVKRARMPA